VFYTSGYRSIQILHLGRALLTRLQDTGVGRRVVLLFSVAFSGPTLPHSRMLWLTAGVRCYTDWPWPVGQSLCLDHDQLPVLFSDVKSSRKSWSRGQNLSSDWASSICHRHVLELFILASWKWVQLVIIVSLQWLSTKVIYLLTLCYWYKLVQVHIHSSILLYLTISCLSFVFCRLSQYGLEQLSSASKVCPRLT